MTAPISLVSLADAEAWLGITSDNGGPVDAANLRLAKAVSTAIYGFLDRQVIAAQTVNEVLNGTGTRQLILHEWPVSSIQSLVLGNQVIPPGVDPGPNANYFSSGYLFAPRLSVPPGQPCVVSLIGYSFWRGLLNVGVDYTAGYLIRNERQTIPVQAIQDAPSAAAIALSTGGLPTPIQGSATLGGTAPSITVAQPAGRWATDMGVAYASTGLPLIAVSGAPLQGQYQLGQQGQYIFSTADEGQAVLISYGYVPEVLAYCCLEGMQTLTALQTRDPALKSEKYGDVAWSYYQVGLIGKIAPGSAILTANMTSLLQPYRSLTMAA